MILKLLLTCLLLSHGAYGQEAETSPELRAAREAFQKDRARSIEAANSRYLAALRKLKEMSKGRNFELTKVIEAEIASLDFTKVLVETKWSWFRNVDAKPDKLRFTAEGEVIHQYFKATWAVIDPWTIAVRLDGRIGYLVFDPEMEGFTGRDFDGSDKLVGKKEK